MWEALEARPSREHWPACLSPELRRGRPYRACPRRCSATRSSRIRSGFGAAGGGPTLAVRFWCFNNRDLDREDFIDDMLYG
jgi:hypothetical protein